MKNVIQLDLTYGKANMVENVSQEYPYESSGLKFYKCDNLVPRTLGPIVNNMRFMFPLWESFLYHQITKQIKRLPVTVVAAHWNTLLLRPYSHIVIDITAASTLFSGTFVDRVCATSRSWQRVTFQCPFPYSSPVQADWDGNIKRTFKSSW